MGWSLSKLNCAVGRGAELHAASSSTPYLPQPPPCSSVEEKKMIESPGNLRTEQREKAPAGAQVNIKTDNCSYLHTDSRRQHQTDLERRTLEHNGEEEEKNTTKPQSGIQTYCIARKATSTFSAVMSERLCSSHDFPIPRN